MDTKINDNIKILRELKNYTQDYMADRLEITQAAYSKIEIGKTDININKLKKIAAILEIKPEDLFKFKRSYYFEKKDELSTSMHQHSDISLLSLYQDKVSLLEKLLCKTDIELKRYVEKYGNI